jgi:5-methylcytosine-specific restriction endonuclease McrA
MHPPRDRRAHARFAKRVKARDGHACTTCGSTLDVRATHITPIAEGGGYQPSNGTTLCAVCDKASDPYAR